MNDFGLYFTFGLQHILTWEALDHILFVAALCLRYQFKDYKKILILVTAFTIGHCTTLVLSTLDMLSVQSSLTEFFIAVTILLTAISNVFVKEERRKQKFSFIYIMALLFGMVHGLGFAYGLKAMLGKNESIFLPLLAFNCGIETAQVLVALVMLIISYIFVSILKVQVKAWLLFISGIIFGLSLQMAIERNPFNKENNDEATSNISVDSSRRFSHRPIAVL